MSDDMVPRSRLNEEIARRKELEADHSALKATLTTFEAKAAEAETLRAQLAKVTAEHDTFRVGVEAGITDPEGLSLARWFYDKIQPTEGEQRPSFADYMGKLKSDPTARPKGLTSYFADTTPATPATPAAAAAPQAAPATPATNAPAKPAAPAPAPAPRSTAPLPPTASGAAPAPAPSPSAAGWTRENIAALTPDQFKANRDLLYTEAGQAIKGMFGR